MRNPTLDRLKTKLYELDKEPDKGFCAVTIEVMGESRPAHVFSALQLTLIDAAKTHAPDKWLDMPSSAGHDAQVIAQLIPAAMIFVPSIGGIRHHWTENTSDEDIAVGAQVFVDAIGRVLSGI